MNLKMNIIVENMIKYININQKHRERYLPFGEFRENNRANRYATKIDRLHI
jgi:hypothetical protein